MTFPLRAATVTRRGVIFGAAAGLASLSMAANRTLAASAPRRLIAAPGRQALGYGNATRLADTWSYNGTVPGPLLRYRVGDRLEVDFQNRLDEPTAVHWHGLRPPNAMDGAAPLTQAPVEPGGSMTYAFDLTDAGTYWYHTHFRGWNQQDRGLYGILIVDERKPLQVDQDILLVLDDWVVDKNGQLDPAFGQMHEWAHAGRLGNLATINNSADAAVQLTAGERVRLRLANVANAQIFALLFSGHIPVIVAEDGNPVEPRSLGDKLLVLGPGQRVDLVLDATGAPGSTHPITAYTLTDEVRLGRFVYGAEAGGSGLVGNDVKPLDGNARPILDLANARRLDLTMEGGAMGRMRGAMMSGRMMGMRELVSNGRIWAFNGIAGDMDTPLAVLKRGETAIVDIVNDTAFPHAMHLHGMHFREIARNGEAIDGSWRDTTVLASDDRVSIAFVAEAPGKWMLHCHMIEHQAGGMMTFLEVEGEAG
ncbi:copper oxidase [Acuticoccus sediminis]|uniref:Copper oxidase n=1 Tax=Acuticoccus sediminis TaxID=2184697 RepID=A0A8B2NLQ4_9HYPH|nr:multicopper oxidase family protein [Acuticoccus sediminis]RAH96214.1 copper oxidase [Acuticoccus sediminis]